MGRGPCRRAGAEQPTAHFCQSPAAIEWGSRSGRIHCHSNDIHRGSVWMCWENRRPSKSCWRLNRNQVTASPTDHGSSGCTHCLM